MFQEAPSTEASLRLEAMRDGTEDWWGWGSCVSERRWGRCARITARGGTAWGWFPHDHARSRAHRWGGGGIAGFCKGRFQ